MAKRGDFLGKGWGFPLALDKEGRLSWAAHEESIRQSIFLILATAPGQRPMCPDFGCAIHSLVFETINTALLTRVKATVEDALSQWEPRIILEEIEVRPKEAQLLIDISYRVRATNHRQNLVWPFYLEET